MYDLSTYIFLANYKSIQQTPVKDEKTGDVKEKVTAFIVERSFGGVTRYVYLIESSRSTVWMAVENLPPLVCG